MKRIFAVTLMFCAASTGAFADSGFGFGQAEADPVSLSGELEIGSKIALDEFENLEDWQAGDLAVLRLDLSMSGSQVDGGVSLIVDRQGLENDPSGVLDEAWVRLLSGNLLLEAGRLRQTWGRADVQGPLDVINPLDLTDLRENDFQRRKQAVDQLRLALDFGERSRIESIFLPTFVPMQIATTGDWVPQEVLAVDGMVAPGTWSTLWDAALADMAGVGSFQAGLRYTSTAGSLDFGAQYWYGFLPRPAVVIIPSPDMNWNRFHQLGLDMATAAIGLNIRAELGINLTEDFAGDDAQVYNSALVFALGADRPLPAGFDINVQISGSQRINHNEITSALDIEYDTDALELLVAGALSQSFRRDTISWELACIWEPIVGDWVIMPELALAIGDAEVQLIGGIFGGEETGDLGQFEASSWVGTRLVYSF